MSRYIDAVQFIKILTTATDGTRIPDVDCDNFPRMVSIREVKRLVRQVSTADVQEIKHGHWIEENARPCSTKWICSECREISYTAQHRGAEKQCTLSYCPNCGAKMRGETK